MQFTKMFFLENQTTHHSAPNMVKTFNRLGVYMEKNNANEYVPGRKAAYEVRDVMADGLHFLMLDDKAMDVSSEWEDLPDDMEVVDDEGDLYVD